MADLRPTVVDACTRDGNGGSPTTVVIDDDTLTDDQRRTIARTSGTSHTAFVDTRTATVPAVRFFTAEGELANCGHGTVAAQAVMLHRSGATRHHGHLRAGTRTFAITAVRRGDDIDVWFDQGVIELRAGVDGAGGIVAALGLTPGDVVADDLRAASPGTPRLLVSVRDRATLLSAYPDFPRLAAECRRLGYLGCFTYALSPTGRTATGRMFAPAIGVDEDVANANSTGCLAAHLLDRSGEGHITVDQGDALGRPSSVLATARRTRAGIAATVGGRAHCRP